MHGGYARDEHECERAAEEKERHVHAPRLVGMKDGCFTRDVRTYSRMNVSGEQLYKNVVSCGGALV